MSKEIYVVFDNRSNYDYCFNIKELVKKFEGEFNCSRENTEKQKTFLVSITKEVKRIGKTREFAKTISYKLQFIDSTRFMAILLSNFYDNLTEGFIILNINMDMIIKNGKCVELNAKIVSVFWNIQLLKMLYENKNPCAAIRITKKSLSKSLSTKIC